MVNYSLCSPLAPQRVRFAPQNRLLESAECKYAPILEKYGFRVEYAVLFDRPTVQQTENGLEDWIRMFNKKPFEGMDPAMMQEIIDETVEGLRSTLFVDGKWIVDYVRIRFRAVKIG